MKLTMLLLGFCIHMLYLDGIVVYQKHLISKCDLDAKDQTCLKNANRIYDKFYLKYFNIADLLKFKNIGNKKWRME